MMCELGLCQGKELYHHEAIIEGYFSSRKYKLKNKIFSSVLSYFIEAASMWL